MQSPKFWSSDENKFNWVSNSFFFRCKLKKLCVVVCADREHCIWKSVWTTETLPKATANSSATVDATSSEILTTEFPISWSAAIIACMCRITVFADCFMNKFRIWSLVASTGQQLTHWRELVSLSTLYCKLVCVLTFSSRCGAHFATCHKNVKRKTAQSRQYLFRICNVYTERSGSGKKF